MAKNNNSSLEALASPIAARYEMSEEEAVRFVENFFKTVTDGLAAEQLVKVKSLGTFKVVEMKSRESIDVNTGERILIEGRNKVSFVPDAVMKDLVNKPFAHFEPVPLNDGVEFDDIAPQQKEEETDEVFTAEENAPKTSGARKKNITETEEETEPVAAEESVSESEPEPAPIVEVAAPEPETVAVDEPVSEPEPEPVVVEEPESVVMEESDPNPVTVEEEPADCRKTRIYWLAAMAAVIVAAVVSILVLSPFGSAETDKPAVVQKPVAKPKPAVVKPKSEAVLNAEKIVEKGAYAIDGVMCEITAKDGDTPESVAKQQMGSEAAMYHIMVINQKDSFKPGETIKLPNLVRKKKKR